MGTKIKDNASNSEEKKETLPFVLFLGYW